MFPAPLREDFGDRVIRLCDRLAGDRVGDQCPRRRIQIRRRSPERVEFGRGIVRVRRPLREDFGDRVIRLCDRLAGDRVGGINVRVAESRFVVEVPSALNLAVASFVFPVACASTRAVASFVFPVP